MMIKMFLVGSLLLASLTSQASMIPKTDLKFPVTGNKGVRQAGLTKEQFLQSLKDLVTIYSPVFKKMGGELRIAADWASSEPNASALSGTGGYIQVFGGLARIPGMTSAMLKLVVCHEIGHHIAGYPYVSAVSLASEGQSDYFATIECARKAFANVTKAEVAALNPTAKVTNQCAAQHASEAARNVCAYSTMVGAKLVQVLDVLVNRVPKKPTLESPSTEKARATINDDYPSVQCRLDTMVAGALCTKPMLGVSSTDATIWSYMCTATDNQIGQRPACWFVN